MNRIMLSQNKHRCRLCLKVCSDVINIFREDFPKMIKLLTTIQVDQNDKFPKVACINCTKKVKSAMVMRKQIIRSHRILMEEALAQRSLCNENKSKEVFKFGNNYVNDVGKNETSANNKPTDVILVQSDNDVKMRKDENIILSHSPKSDIIENHISAEKDHNIEKLQKSLNTNEISLVKVNKSVCSESKKQGFFENCIPIKPNLQISKRRTKNASLADLNSRISLNRTNNLRKNVNFNFTSTVKVEPKSRRCVKRQPSPSTYDQLTPIPCKICQKMILKTNMKRHVEIHDNKIVTCPLCGKVTKNTSLRSHIFYFHKCKEDQYVCDQCGRHFRYRSKFKLHMKKEHGGTKDFECHICGRGFFEKKYLKKHIDSLHNKIRPYICDYCGKYFSTKHALNVHFRQHTENAPFKCDTCGQRFKQKVSLKTHRRQAHDIFEEESIFCEICGKGFGSKVALTSHFRLHERKKCPHCSENFVRDEYLERHIKEKHEPLSETENSKELLDVAKDAENICKVEEK